jgi:hypothetical protein
VFDTRNLDKNGKEKVDKIKWKPPPKSKFGEQMTRAIVTEKERQQMDLHEKFETVKDLLYLNNYLKADPRRERSHFNQRDLWLLSEYQHAVKATNATTTSKMNKQAHLASLGLTRKPRPKEIMYGLTEKEKVEQVHRQLADGFKRRFSKLPQTDF